ncbi:aquaporin-3-like [Nerophis ophidion]|uniref:aquaporin-3-like n=1 Tax=Nerophis ophidion TaxID=159077 RepID=UPI002ADF3594|nr:aquaporin-3-like [Nerophis ophidion]
MGKQKDMLAKPEGTFWIGHTLFRRGMAECLGTLILVDECRLSWVLGAGGGARSQGRGAEKVRGERPLLESERASAEEGLEEETKRFKDACKERCHFTVTLLGKPRRPRTFALFFFFQTLGAFLAAAVVFCVYFGYRNVLAIIDPHNNSVQEGLEAFPMGFLVMVIGLSMGFNSGYAINPARDLGPRIFRAIAGWGLKVFTAIFKENVNNYWFLIPISGPSVGAAVAVMVYQLMVGYHLSKESSHKMKKKQRDEGSRLKLSDLAANKDAA